MCYFEGVGVINYLKAETDRVEKLGSRLHMVPNSNSLMVIFPFKIKNNHTIRMIILLKFVINNENYLKKNICILKKHNLLFINKYIYIYRAFYLILKLKNNELDCL
jgi:hypothetical protein